MCTSSANRLTGRLALVTGASQGIGRAIAAALHEEEMRLVLTGRSLKRLRWADTLDRQSNRVQRFRADLASPVAVSALAENVRQQADGLDLLVHCGAVYHRGSWRASTRREMSRLFETNLFGPVQLTQELLPLLENARGTIILINSSIVNSTGADAGHYAAAKHALRSFADSLRAEVTAAGIRVLSVYPGRTATPMQARIFRDEGKDYRPDDLLQPEDIAEAVVGCLKLSDSADVTDLHIRPRKPPVVEHRNPSDRTP